MLVVVLLMPYYFTSSNKIPLIHSSFIPLKSVINVIPITSALLNLVIGTATNTGTSPDVESASFKAIEKASFVPKTYLITFPVATS